MEIIKVDPRKKNIGIVGYAKEHNYTQLHVLIDKRIKDSQSYDADFKMSNEEVFTLEDLEVLEEGYVVVPLKDTVLEEGKLEIQIIGHQAETTVKSCVYNAKVAKSVNALQKELEELNPSLADYLYKNTVKVVDALPKSPKVGDIIALRKPVKIEENIEDPWNNIIINGPDTGFYIYDESGKLVGVNIDDAIFYNNKLQFGPINYRDFKYDATKNMYGVIGIGDFFGIRYIIRVGSAKNIEIKDGVFQDLFVIEILEQTGDGNFSGKGLFFANCENFYNDVNTLPNIWYVVDNKNETTNIATEKDFEYFTQLWEEEWGVADLWEMFGGNAEDLENANIVITPQICIDTLKQFCSIDGIIVDTPEEEDDGLSKTFYIADKNEQGKIIWKKYLSNINEDALPELDETLIYKDGKLAVNTTNELSEDNTLPITSAAVQMQIGNIEELLKTI